MSSVRNNFAKLKIINSFSPVKTVMRGEDPHPARCGVCPEQCGYRSNEDFWWSATVITSTKLRGRGIKPRPAYRWIVTGRNLIYV